MLSKVRALFTEGHDRSIKARKNILASFLFKGISILISLLLVPLTIEYVNETQYGLWLTISSVVSWFVMFDLGLGNGLRNRFAESKAKGDDHLVQSYVSTTYAILSFVGAGMLVLFVGLYFLVDWFTVFNISPDEVSNVAEVVLLVFSFFALQFVVKLINTILIADQRPAWNNAINASASLLSLGLIFVLTRTTDGSLLYLALAISLSNLVIPLLLSLWLFAGQYKMYRPKWSAVDFSQSKDLMSLGIKFFVMNGAALIVMATDNMIISQMETPEEVTPYQVAFKYFNVVIMGFTIITTPYWSAITDAYTRGELNWIRKSTRTINLLWLLVVAGVGIMLFAAEWVFSLWVPTVSIPFLLCALMAAFALMNTGTMIYSNFLAGVGKVRLSVIHSIVVAILNIPLSWLFAGPLGMGSAGVILASCVCLGLRVIFQPIQYYKIMNGTARGIWNQ